jgi:tuftelin-interacting protein 11
VVVEPFQWVMRWRKMAPISLLSDLLVKSFFPKWHKVLYTWLVDGNANYDEVSEW